MEVGGTTSAGRRHLVRTLGRETAVVGGGVVAYFGVRGLTEGDAGIAVANAHRLLALERRLGLDHEEVVQAAMTGSDALTTFANWVYIYGHWPVIVTALLWLAVRHRREYLRLRNGMLVSGAIGMVLFATYPVAPPRLADLGFVDTVAEQSGAYRVLQPPAFVNQYAALPSLHVGWDLLVGLTVAAAAGGLWLRWAARLMPVLMAWAVVATANHYLLDVVGGVALALVGLGVALLLERRRDARPEPAAAELPVPRRAADDLAGCRR